MCLYKKIMNKELYITINHLDEFINASSIKVNDVLTLKKDINNEFDDEAIIALNENNFKCGYVANSVSSVVRGTYSAGRIYDLIKENNTCKVKFIALESNFLIAQL